MGSMLRSRRFLICCLASVLPAAAQLDSTALRAKYGSPLNRETFRIPAGFDLVVDYGAGGQVCRLELPALIHLIPAPEKPYRESEMEQRMFVFLAELVPDSMRGLQLTRGVEAMGAISREFVVYEHVTISTTKYANDPFKGTKTVTFKNSDCQDLTRPNVNAKAPAQLH
jgi:hypothetical protein